MSYAERRETPLQANITFVITEECNLRCKYCYEENKKKRVIDIDVVKKSLKHIKKQYQKFDTVVWDFIGGEPLMEPELIEEIIKAIREEFKGHKWLDKELYSMTTNATLLGDPKVRALLEKYNPEIQIGISLDGCKIIHDMNRSNSYDKVMENFDYWRTNYPVQATKATLNHEALPYAYESFLHLIGLGLKIIHMNCVYEDVWKEGDPEIFREQLYKIANFLLDSGLYKYINTNMFPTSMTPKFLEGVRVKKESEFQERRAWCGSGTCMLAVGPDGMFYPCMRFFTAAKEHQYEIGNIETGIDMDKARPFFFTNKQKSDKCSVCEYDEYCPHCLAWDYQNTGTIFERATHSCEMLKVQFEVSKYYYAAKDKEPEEELTTQEKVFKCTLNKHLPLIVAQTGEPEETFDEDGVSCIKVPFTMSTKPILNAKKYFPTEQKRLPKEVEENIKITYQDGTVKTLSEIVPPEKTEEGD